MRKHILVLIALVTIISLPMVARSAQWLIYSNARFGTTADIPAQGFVAQPPSENGDGRAWFSTDGRSEILVFAALAVMVDNLRDYRRDTLGYARDGGVDIVYNAGKKNWFVYSGFLGGDIVYEKVLMTRSCGSLVAHHLFLRYPASQKKAFDSIVTHMSRSLQVQPVADTCN